MSNQNWPEHLKHLAPAAEANPYASLTPPELQLLLLIGKRAANIVRAHFADRNMPCEVHPDVIAQDFAVVHLSQPLRLLALLEAPQLEFIDEFRTVQQNINRPLAFFPRDVKLAFAATGGVYIPGN